MVANADGQSIVHGHKFSTVVPGSVTGDNVMHELAGIDLAMKLHYLRGVYYFMASEAIERVDITTLKEPMFPVLNIYYPVAGRIRRSESGYYPIIKCNDSGVRIIEAKCEKTIDEWLEMKELSRYRYLVSDKILGPDLHFSPTVLVQFTRFKCGGMAVGFSWAHVLGDAVSATNCINQWGRFPTGNRLPKTHQIPQIKSTKVIETLPCAPKPLSVKQVEPVGDCWQAPSNCRMATFSFQITEAKLKHIDSEVSSQTPIPSFEALSAMFWQCLAKIRGGEPKVVTICRSNSSGERSSILSNDQVISTVTTDSCPDIAKLSELALSIVKQTTDEKRAIEGLIDKESGAPDAILYGANLTFVDLEGVDFYGLELKGQKPIHVEYSIDGVGNEGAVLVQRSSGNNGGRMVTVILPEDQVSQLKEVLQTEWTIT